MFASIVIEGLCQYLATELEVNGYGPAYQLPDGKIVMFSDIHKRERTYIGLDDSRGNHFYIRHLSDFIDEKGEDKKRSAGACTTRQTITLPLRLVAVWTCTAPETLCEKMKGLLAMAPGTITDPAIVGPVNIEFNRTSVIFEAIYKLETLKEKVAWNTNSKLCLIDFTISYKYDFCSIDPATIEIC